VKRILFVDDEPRMLEGLKRMLYPLRREWEMVFVTEATEALRRLQEDAFDVLVTDLRMPHMSGAELLESVKRAHPQIVRIVLSGTVDQEFTLRSVALAHQYLSKPCDPDVLRVTVERAFFLRDVLEEPGLKRLVASVQSLPSAPSMYLRLVEALRSPHASAAMIGAIVAQDSSMTAKILQLVNSAFFGVRRRITNPAEAVVYLGVETIRSLALTASVFTQFEGRNPALKIEELQGHSVAVGTLARHIAVSAGLDKQATDEAFAGGLMHDLGKLVLAANFSEEYRRVPDGEDRAGALAAELASFGATHAAVGAYLLWLWGLPEAVTEVVARHHSDPESGIMSPAAAVYFANAIVRGGAVLDHVREVGRLLGVRHLADWESRAEDLLSKAMPC
jgi:putative nucleotidyltransferase with HDIG domain